MAMEHCMNKYFLQSVESIREMIAYDSSYQVSEDYPFGEGAALCLRAFLNLARSFGFETKNYYDYVGEIIFGEGKELAILAHLDVVPAGSGWKYPPFAAVVNDDESTGGVKGKKIWGRGTMDDKGPAVSCLYALKALKDQGFVPKRKIKFILGCNEESGWRCIDYYKAHAVMPEEGFTPDADFPAIYAEKGILHLLLTFPLSSNDCPFLQGGYAANMVCDQAVARVSKRIGNALSVHKNPIADTTLTYDNSTGLLRAFGKSAHGSTPEKGANAIYSILALLSPFDEGAKLAYDVLVNDSLGLTTLQDETGRCTLSAGKVSLEGNKLKITLDVRFPATMQKECVLQRLQHGGISVAVLHEQAPLYNDPKDALISTLMGVYNEITGKNERPVAIGGGTYARAIKKGCAFGPEMEGDEATIHQPNEYITFERIKLLNQIYYEAVKKLCE
ncbi:MAG: Sapep family Mn(2+)-dependent dipeptidase [Clostridia bacterium]|nr:Sapep family Mn(2+)-dependent dipeptidase [Clostridia bacterium]